MKKILLFSVFCFLVSCGSNQTEKTSELNQVYIGAYYAIVDDFECKLVLQENAIFSILINSIGSKSECEGKWKQKKSHIELKCNVSEKIEHLLQGGNISGKEITLRIAKKGTLIYGKIPLRKIAK